MKNGVSAIVPAYNEEKKIKNVLKALKRSKDINEIICVNDGSTDKTLEILQLTSGITVINLKRNRGKGFAIARGIEKAKGEIVLLVDADIRGLTDNHIAQLVGALRSGKYDFAIGYRSSRVEATVGVPLSGERTYFKKDLLPHLKILEKKGLGALELYLNYEFRAKRKKIIQLKGVYSHAKHKKYSSYQLATKLYAAETYYILNEFIRRRNHLSYFLHSYLSYLYLRSQLLLADLSFSMGGDFDILGVIPQGTVVSSGARSCFAGKQINTTVCLAERDLAPPDRTSNMYYVYILKCSSGDLYIGYSDDLRERVENHNKGRVRSTKSKRPVVLVYYEAYKNKRDATRRERQLKNHKAKIDLVGQLTYSLG